MDNTMDLLVCFCSQDGDTFYLLESENVPRELYQSILAEQANKMWRVFFQGEKDGVADTLNDLMENGELKPSTNIVHKPARIVLIGEIW
jgi:hypothetical protein